MRVPRRYIILIDGKPLLVIRAYTKRQARELVEVRLADTTARPDRCATMIPATMHGLPAMACVSRDAEGHPPLMERRGDGVRRRVDAHVARASSPWSATGWRSSRHEDMDTQLAPHVVPFVATCVEQAKRHYDPAKIGRVTDGDRQLRSERCARAAKSREGDHFAIAVGLAS